MGGKIECFWGNSTALFPMENSTQKGFFSVTTLTFNVWVRVGVSSSCIFERSRWSEYKRPLCPTSEHHCVCFRLCFLICECVELELAKVILKKNLSRTFVSCLRKEKLK